MPHSNKESVLCDVRYLVWMWLSRVDATDLIHDERQNAELQQELYVDANQADTHLLWAHVRLEWRTGACRASSLRILRHACKQHLLHQSRHNTYKTQRGVLLSAFETTAPPQPSVWRRSICHACTCECKLLGSSSQHCTLESLRRSRRLPRLCKCGAWFGCCWWPGGIGGPYGLNPNGIIIGKTGPNCGYGRSCWGAGPLEPEVLAWAVAEGEWKQALETRWPLAAVEVADADPAEPANDIKPSCCEVLG